jgi:hypothetical protein
MRTILATLLLVGALVPTTFATSGGPAVSERQRAIVNFERPTKVATSILMGPYLVVHDDAKMAEGEPCTSFYQVETSRGREEAAVSFHCIPRMREVVGRFTMATEWDYELGMYAMTEYQFAGDAEGHGVPLTAAALPRNCFGTGRAPATGDPAPLQ